MATATATVGGCYKRKDLGNELASYDFWSGVCVFAVVASRQHVICMLFTFKRV